MASVTIFIRARNEAELLPRCLERIFSQKGGHEVEVILLDSGSSDTTVEIARSFPVTVYTISPTLFTYASALNAGVAWSTHSLFVALSAHAVPANDMWLSELVAPLLSDTSVIASYSRQLPWPDVSIPEALQIKWAFPARSSVTTPDTWKLSLAESKEPTTIACLSNASAAYRRSFLIEHPFRELPLSEDRACGVEILQSGGSISYVATSIVYHSHAPSFQSFRHIARRATVARFRINNSVGGPRGGQAPPPGFWRLSSAFLKIPLYIFWLNFTAWIPIVAPNRPNRARELLWRAVSLATTIGKYEGLRDIATKPQRALEIADCSEILAAQNSV